MIKKELFLIMLLFVSIITWAQAPLQKHTASVTTDFSNWPTWANLQSPSNISGYMQGSTSPNIYGQIYNATATPPAGSQTGIIAQVGFGPRGILPTDPSWQWFNASYNTQVGNNDEFSGNFTIPQNGYYDYLFRYSLDANIGWVYGALNNMFYSDISGYTAGAGFNPLSQYLSSNAGKLTVGGNQPPSGITLSSTSIDENVAANSTVGTLSSTDPFVGNSFTYTLVTGSGDTDNAAFNISGNALRITQSPDYETKNNYSIRIRTTTVDDNLTYEKAFTITINDVTESIAPTAIAPTEGNGTSSNPYQIATLDNLYWLTQTSSAWNSYFIQTADIDASSISNFSPIGDGTTRFTGQYNGKGHTITNVTISRSTSDYIGLFGNIDSGATVDSIGVGIDNITGHNYVGGLAGYNTGTVRFCYTTGVVSGSLGVGGFIGYNSGGAVSYSHSSVATTGNYDVAAFIGDNVNSSNINYCYATGNSIGSTVSGCYTSGGLVGWNESNISNCYATGNVIGIAPVGGLVGGIGGSGTVSNSYAVGTVTGTNPGGLAGSSSGSITSSFYNNEIFTASTSYGTGKTTAELKIQSTFTNAGWDFVGESSNDTNDSWALSSNINNGYPCFTWQGTLAIPTVTTQAASSITAATAIGNGNITSLGFPNPSAYGVCWSTTQGAETVTGNFVNNGAASATGAFTASITNLSVNTTYYVRAYATNSAGTAYGDEVSFTTPDTYNITYNLNGGTNDAANAATYTYGVGFTLSNPTQTGYTFGGWYDNAIFTGTALTAISTTATGDVTLYAKWTVNTYTISASAGNNGNISPSGEVIATYGSDQSFTITANNSYHIKDVLVDGNSVGAVSSYTFSSVAANHTIAASFDITTGIEETSQTGVTLYPNPCRNSFIVNAGGESTMLYMYDVNGKLTLSQSIQGKSTVNVSSLSEGIYVVKIDGRNYKLIKTH
jgi:uncharacterized repeat protein (TIGR02543 family)